MATQLSEHDRAVLNCAFNPNLPITEAEIYPEVPIDKDENEHDETFITSKKLELEAVQLAEEGKLAESLNQLNEAIKLTPQRPSLFNNRAHVYQYLRKFEEALIDLTHAINLCSENHRKTLSQAYVQRGILYKRANRIDCATEDFQKAKQLGSIFARNQLVQLNPYAALCNQMLRQVGDRF